MDTRHPFGDMVASSNKGLPITYWIKTGESSPLILLKLAKSLFNNIEFCIKEMSLLMSQERVLKIPTDVLHRLWRLATV